VVSYDDIKVKNYSLSAGQYFEVKIEYVDINQREFEEKLNSYNETLDELFTEAIPLNQEIHKNLRQLKYGS